MARFRPSYGWQAYLWPLLMVAISIPITIFLDNHDFGEANLIMIFLIGVVMVALKAGRGPSVAATVLGILTFNFLFVDPRYTFSVNESHYLITFGSMLAVGLIVSTLLARFRAEAQTAHMREQRTAALYALSRDLASTRGRDNLLYTAMTHIHEVFDSDIIIFLPQPDERLQAWEPQDDAHLGQASCSLPNATEQPVAQWVYEHQACAGLGTTMHPGANALYLPLRGSQHMVGVLGIRPALPNRFQSHEQMRLLETFANQTALAIERANLAEEAQQAHVAAASERMRAALLSSVSHDLRTPLAVITGATSTLLQGAATLEAATQQELLQTAYDEAERLNRLVANLLDMTRLEAGSLRARKEWQLLDEVVGAALLRLERIPDHALALGNRQLTVHLAADLPLVPLDDVLIEQVLVNLLDNALQHTPAGTALQVRAWPQGQQVLIEVADAGQGLAPGTEQRVFEKFYHGPSPAQGRSSVGLGLAICRGMVEAHGGQIWAENRPEGGAAFRFSLPLDGNGAPPQLPDE